MRKISLFSLSLLVGSLFLATTCQAQTLTELVRPEAIALDATSDAQASSEASLSAVVNPEAKQSIQEKKDQDLTEIAGGKTDALATYLLEQPAPKRAWYNVLKIAFRGAVNRGLPSNVLVILILFPLIAAIIAFSRHVVGLRGFGVYTPAVLAVALVSTGILLGIGTFLIIMLTTLLLQKLFKKFNLAHLPKTALILWGVCVTLIIFLILTAYFRLESFFSLSIFPLLILVSLSENFTSTQAFASTKEALRLTLETLILAVIAALIMGSNALQRFAIVNPEISLLSILIMSLLIGRYQGLRLFELIRFQALLKKKD